jgi:hypothetical protein
MRDFSVREILTPSTPLGRGAGVAAMLNCAKRSFRGRKIVRHHRLGFKLGQSLEMKTNPSRPTGTTGSETFLPPARLPAAFATMKIQCSILRTAAVLAAVVLTGLVSSAQPAADPGWPRMSTEGEQQLTIYQPQVDYWSGYTNIHFRCAIAVKGVTAQERFGVAEIDAVTFLDQPNRLVGLYPMQRDLRFPGASDADAALLRAAVDRMRPPDQAITVSLDRVLACLNPSQAARQRAVEVNLNPPRIYYSAQPAILVMFLGTPQFKPAATNQTGLLFALNSNWDVFYDTTGQQYFLLNQSNWLAAPTLQGPWAPAQTLPASFATLPANNNWAEVRQNIPGQPAASAPAVFVSTQPAELILTQGDPSYTPIAGTQLLRVANTDSTLFQNSGDQQFYYLVAGRWFRAPGLNGPWTPATKNLPADFAQIPDSDPAAFVKASVPGTHDAQDATLLASVPTTTTVYLTNATVQVAYNGAPVFRPIAGTAVQYAVNSPYSVLLAGGQYYCCDQGVWFISAGATGPWAFCTSVPAAIYTIPPSSPLFNVTFVTVQSFTATTVTYCQTPGYSGEYVGTTGTVMFGAGMPVGADTAQQDTNYNCYPDPDYYSYGCGACYDYSYGGYYYPAYGWYGPYGNVSYTTAYNPATGTYMRSAYAYGPNGSATVKQAYNPYTGGYARAAQVNTAYGSATRAYAYNPTTGNAAWGASRSSAYGSAGAVRTSQGTGAVAWNTQNGQGAVAKTSSGDVYAAKDGTVYQRDSAGNWSQNTGSGWEPVSKTQPAARSDGATAPAQPQAGYRPQPTAAAYQNQNYQNMESQAQSRQWGNQQSQRTQSWQNSGGRSFGGGGGRRR